MTDRTNAQAAERFSLATTGAAIGTTAADWKLVADDSTIVSDNTDSNGLAYVVLQDGEVLLPGPHYIELTSGGKTRRVYSDVTGMIGRLSIADLVKALRGLGSGVFQDVDDELAVDAPGGMNVRVGTGAGLIAGSAYSNASAQTLAVAAADPTQARIDRVVVRVSLAAATYGRVVLAVVSGTPAALPVAPALTQSLSGDWEEGLATVAVAAAAAAITGGNITDGRTLLNKLDGTGTFTSMDLIATDDLTVTDDASIGGDLAVGGALTLGTELAVADGGTGASTAAAALANLGLTATAAELNFTDGVTGAIQDQLDAKAPLADPTFTGTLAAADVAASGTLSVAGNADFSGVAVVSVDAVNALDVEQADGTNIVHVDTIEPRFEIRNATPLTVYSDDGSNVVFDVDGATGHTRFPGTAPSAAVGAAAGTGASITTVVGSDTAGVVTVATGTSPTTGILATITFAEAMGTTEYAVVLTTNGASSNAMTLCAANKASASFEIRTGVAPSASNTAIVAWHVFRWS